MAQIDEIHRKYIYFKKPDETKYPEYEEESRIGLQKVIM